jgi:hypothetical protein
VRSSIPAIPFIGEAKGGRPATQGGGRVAKEFKHLPPLSTKEHCGEPKRKKGKAKERREREDLMAWRPHHGRPTGHLLKITSNFVSHFDMSPRSPKFKPFSFSCFKFFYFFLKIFLFLDNANEEN